GAVCATRKKTGPDTPYFEDAPEKFRTALARLDAGANVTSEEHAAALGVVLSQSRRRDALTLWHLLAPVPDSDRGRGFERLAQVVPAPAGVIREGIVRLDREMVDLWWNELGFGDTALWRHLERSWPQEMCPCHVSPLRGSHLIQHNPRPPGLG